MISGLNQRSRAVSASWFRMQVVLFKRKSLCYGSATYGYSLYTLVLTTCQIQVVNATLHLSAICTNMVTSKGMLSNILKKKGFCLKLTQVLAIVHCGERLTKWNNSPSGPSTTSQRHPELDCGVWRGGQPGQVGRGRHWGFGALLGSHQDLTKSDQMCSYLL